MPRLSPTPTAREISLCKKSLWISSTIGAACWPASINLSSLNGGNGFIINGVSAGDNSGGSVSSAGDMNNDGLADIVTGAHLADPNGDKSGASYVIFDVTAVNGDVIFADSFE